MQATYVTLNFLVVTLKISKKKKGKFIFLILFNPIQPKISFQHVMNTEKKMSKLIFVLSAESL